MTLFACFYFRPEVLIPDLMTLAPKGASTEEDTVDEPLAALEGNRECSKSDLVGVTV